MNILITGAGSVMGQSIYKSLAMHDFGKEIKIHFANTLELAAGRYFSHPSAPVVKTPIFPLAASIEYSDFLKHYVDEHKIDIVFSGTQHELIKIAMFRDQTFKAATISSNVLANFCMDKINTCRILKHSGIRVPKTYSLNEYLQSTFKNEPVVVKPNHSSSSRDIFHLSKHEDILALISNKKINSDNFLVQEQLFGEEYTCGCYIDRYTKRITHITFRRTLTADGATFYGEIVEYPLITRYIIDICQALIDKGLDFGHINIQFILTDEGPVLFEINGRLSSTEASKAYYGFNSCAAFVTNIVNKQPYKQWKIASSGRFLRFYEEIYFD